MLVGYILTSVYSILFEGECHVCGADMKHPTHDGYNHGRPQVLRRGRSSHAYGVDLFEEVCSS